jgi:hypothetical protein
MVYCLSDFWWDLEIEGIRNYEEESKKIIDENFLQFKNK